MLNSNLTAEEIELFFTMDTQMGISARTLGKLKEEGIVKPQDLVHFNEKTLKQVAENLRKAHTSNGGSTTEGQDQGPYIFSAMSLKKMAETAELLRFYKTVGRELNAESIQYETVTENFTEQWESLKERKEAKEAEVPKISKSLPVLKWTEAFNDFLNRTIGVRTIPLSYITRDKVIPDGLPNRMENKPHSVDGSVTDDLITHASHDHPRFKDDNAQVYYFLEEATRSTEFASSIKPYQRLKNGRQAYISICKQYAGRDKWETEIRTQANIIYTSQWKGQSNFTLEKFVALHRNAFISLKQCAEHVTYQLPNEHTRVGYFLNAIQTTDAGLQAAMASVEQDDGPNGKRNDFEAMASFLLPKDPVARKSTISGKRDHGAMIADAQCEVSSGFGTKQGIGKTGVHLRYHEGNEYRKLSKAQKDELNEWRRTTDWGGMGKPTPKGKGKTFNDGKTKHPKSGKNKFKNKKSRGTPSDVSRVNKQYKKGSDDKDLDALIMSLQTGGDQESASKKARFENPVTQVNTSALKTILRRVKNGNEDE